MITGALKITGSWSVLGATKIIRFQSSEDVKVQTHWEFDAVVLSNITNQSKMKLKHFGTLLTFG